MFALSSKQRPRELRRRVVLPARLRAGGGWSDACILNISSRGLLIQARSMGPEGSTVELRRGDYAITARVMWQDGARAGLQSDNLLPVDEILSLSQSSQLRLVASDGQFIDRRRRPRSRQIDARARGKILEFAGTAMIAGSVALAIAVTAAGALSEPFAHIESALAGSPK